MTTRSIPLFVAKYAANLETTEYTCPSGTRTIIDKLTGYNGTGSAASLTVKLVPNGGAAAATNVIAVKSIQPGDTYTFPEIVGHALEPGGIISVLCGTASAVVIRSSGREIS